MNRLLDKDKILIIGAGPAGMACAYTLTKAGQGATVIEKDDAPGGLCRTLNFHGYLFDIGGHRFLSHSKEINDLWSKVMGKDMLQVKRLSRIYYRKKFFNYPLTFLNTFCNLGLAESLLCICDYLRCKILKPGNDNTFEGWIINRFGKRLFKIFFESYTRKVWAVAPRDISASWAMQRIRGLSLRVAIQKAILGVKAKTPKTLSEEFSYPKNGPGEFYNRLKDLVLAQGGQFSFGKDVVKIKHDGKKILAVEIDDLRKNQKEELALDYLFSGIPLPALVKLLDPLPPQNIIAAAEKLHFRSFLVVNVIFDKKSFFSDQWIYVHSPEVRLGRIQNYKNWSPSMVVDSEKTSLGLEYFCDKGDGLWNMNDIDLINYAVGELEKIGISSRRYLIDGFVIRRPDVYPLYSLDYREKVDTIRQYLEGFPNFQTMGRGGLFRYDNSDHALLTGIYAANNFLGKEPCDIWSINTEQDYIES